MKLIAAQCPQCGASLNIAENRKVCFCSYCGTKVLLDDGSRTITHVYIDQTREKELELEKTKLAAEQARNHVDRKQKRIVAAATCVVAVFALTVLILISGDFNILLNFCLMLAGCSTAMVRLLKKGAYLGAMVFACILAVGIVAFMVLRNDFNTTFIIALMLTAILHIVAGIVRKSA